MAHAGIADRVSGREIIGAIDHDIATIDQRGGVLRVETDFVCLDLYERIERSERARGTVDFQLTNSVGPVQNLALKVGELDAIRIDDSNETDAGRDQIQRNGRAESARADNQHPCALESLLTGDADTGQGQMPGIPIHFVAGQRRRASLTLRVSHGDKISDLGVEDFLLLARQTAFCDASIKREVCEVA